jgi:hypothetical protein
MRPLRKTITVFAAFIALVAINQPHADACTTFGCKAEFEEIFLNPTDQFFDLTQASPTAIFNFNLVAAGGEAVLYNKDTTVNKHYAPAPDVTQFNPLKTFIKTAELEIKFSDNDIVPDIVDINAGISDANKSGSTDIYYGNLNLGTKKIRGTKKFDYIRQYDVLSFDLIELGFGQALQDGKFVTMVMDPAILGINNNFRIEWASLEVETACLPPVPPTPPAPVPEPSTIILLGAGLVGASLMRKKREN